MKSLQGIFLPKWVKITSKHFGRQRKKKQMYVACPRNKTGVIAVRNIYIQLRKIFHQSIFQLLQFSDQHKASWEGALWHRIQAYVLLVSQAAASSMENKNHRILDFMNPKVFLLILWWGFSNFFFFSRLGARFLQFCFHVELNPMHYGCQMPPIGSDSA